MQSHQRGLGGIRGFDIQRAGQRTDGSLTEEFGQGQGLVEAVLDHGDQPDRQERMASQVEEVVGDADGPGLEQLFPNPDQFQFGAAGGRHKGSGSASPRLHQGRQSLAIELAIGGEGKRIQHGESRRDHVIRQFLPEIVTEGRHEEALLSPAQGVVGQRGSSRRHGHGLPHTDGGRAAPVEQDIEA